MKTLVSLASSASLAVLLPAQASDRLADLERRCAEQERQIQILELENSRLRGGQSAQTAPASPQSPITQSPSTEASSNPVANERFHVVQRGETLSEIAKIHGVKTRELVTLNQLKNSGIIQIGQKLRLPAETQSSTSEQTKGAPVVRGTHKVKQGETFYSIARTYGLSVDHLSTANPSVEPRALRVGQELKLVARQAESEAQVAEQTTPAARPTTETNELQGTQTIMNQRPTVRRVPITEQITLQEFADDYSMDVARLKRLNGLSDARYQPNTVLAEGSALFVSAQPLD
ncbi:MAG: LysM peptidoglycan-binding domain-containing protein [Haloferula sp.]